MLFVLIKYLFCRLSKLNLFNIDVLVCSYFVILMFSGIMDYEEVRRKYIGGKFLGFFY